MSNTGLIHEPIQPNTGFFGGVAGELPDIHPSGDWESFLPPFETQNKFSLESLGCVSYSRLNACEIQARFYGKTLNLSDRSLAWASGTTHNGNTFSAVDYWIKKRGACDEDEWPWNKILTWEEFYETPPVDVQDEMKKLFQDWDIGMRVYVPLTISSLQAALKKGPLWFGNSDHAMVIYRVDTQIHIWDSYGQNGDGRKHFPLSYLDQIVSAYLVPFTPKPITPKPMLNVPPNCKIVIVDGHGERYMSVDGTRLYKDDAGLIEGELQARNATPDAHGVTRTNGYPVVHLRSADVVGIPVVNLKNVPV